MPDCCQISFQSYYYSGLICVFQASSVILLNMDLIIALLQNLEMARLPHSKGNVTSSCLQIWRITLKALSSRVQYKYRNQPCWMNGWLWSLFDHLVLNSTHASAGDDSAMIVLGWETARAKTARDHYSYCIISESGQSSYSSISALMKATTGNWQPYLTAEFTSRNAGCYYSTLFPVHIKCKLSVQCAVRIECKLLVYFGACGVRGEAANQFLCFINFFISVSFIAPEL